MTPIEQREMRGVSVKQAIVFLISVIGIIVSVVYGYANIMNELKSGSESREVIKVNMETLKLELKNVQTNQNTTELRLMKLELQMQDIIDSKKR